MIAGLLHGCFDPPHAGHLQIARAATRLCDRLTILIHQPVRDEGRAPRVELSLRRAWMEELVVGARVVAIDRPMPPAPVDAGSAAAWRELIAAVHAEPLSLLFAGDPEAELAASALGVRFVPLGNRLLDTDKKALGSLSSSLVRADPFAHWRHLPAPVREFFAPLIVLHGSESVGKSMMGARLAWLYDTLIVGEFGRADCLVHGTQTSVDDLEWIGRAQSAMIEEARPWCRQRLLADTDALMTIAWSRMLHGREPPALWDFPRGDLYLLLEPDVPFVADGLRLFSDPAQRTEFHRLCAQVLEEAGVRTVVISGSEWEIRFERAVAAIDRLGPRR